MTRTPLPYLGVAILWVRPPCRASLVGSTWRVESNCVQAARAHAAQAAGRGARRVRRDTIAFSIHKRGHEGGMAMRKA